MFILKNIYLMIFEIFKIVDNKNNRKKEMGGTGLENRDRNFLLSQIWKFT